MLTQSLRIDMAKLVSSLTERLRELFKKSGQNIDTSLTGIKELAKTAEIDVNKIKDALGCKLEELRAQCPHYNVTGVCDAPPHEIKRCPFHQDGACGLRN